MSASPPPTNAKWYVKAFHVQMAAFLSSMAVGLPVFVLWPGRQLWRPQLPLPAAMPIVFKVVLGALAPIVLGWLSVQTTRYTLYIFGRGSYDKPIIAPPPRVNCVMFGTLGLVFVGIALSEPGGGMLPLRIVGSLVGAFMSFLSLTGFLWARAEATKTRENQLS
jgi:hypothetical protein